MTPALVGIVIAGGCIAIIVYRILRPGFHGIANVDPQPMNVERLMGSVGIVTCPVSPASGQIEVLGELWDARCDGTELLVGTQVRVLGNESTQLIVVTAAN